MATDAADEVAVAAGQVERDERAQAVADHHGRCGVEAVEQRHGVLGLLLDRGPHVRLGRAAGAVAAARIRDHAPGQVGPRRAARRPCTSSTDGPVPATE